MLSLKDTKRGQKRVFSWSGRMQWGREQKSPTDLFFAPSFPPPPLSTHPSSPPTPLPLQTPQRFHTLTRTRSSPITAMSSPGPIADQDPTDAASPPAGASTSAQTAASFTTLRANRGPPGLSPAATAHAHLLTVPESITDFRLFDGENSPQNIAVYGFGLGALFGASLIVATIVETSIPQFWFFLAALGVFHSLEYIAIALFNPTKLNLDCKSDPSRRHPERIRSNCH